MPIVLVSTRHRRLLEDVADGLDLVGPDWRLEQSVDLDAIFGGRGSDPPEAVVLDLSGHLGRRGTIRAITEESKRERAVPVIALVSRSGLGLIDVELGLDDFTLLPADADELSARLKLLISRPQQEGRGRSGGPGQIQLGDLWIDPTRDEVWVGQRQVTLTFKEYELLRLLASEPGRVFTREVLLDRVWGYDYFGGTRTVDVHIRRLRSKAEDPEHTFVETVRNVGYRLRPDSATREL